MIIKSKAILRALRVQGFRGLGWTGSPPADSSEITGALIEERATVNDIPIDPATVNIPQLKVDYDTIEPALRAKRTEAEDDRAYIRTHPQIKALIRKRPQAIESYIENNVTDLTSAKEVISILAVAISIMADKIVDT